MAPGEKNTRKLQAVIPTPTEIIGRVYRELGRPAPEVLEYASLEDAVADIENWRQRVENFMVCWWEWSYALLHPCGEFAREQLFDREFQFDVKRRLNNVPPLWTIEPWAEIPREPRELFQLYMTTAVDSYHRAEPTSADRFISQRVESDRDLMAVLTDLLDRDADTCPLPPSPFAFLGAQSWIQVEFDMLRNIRAYLKVPVCDEHYQNVRLLAEHNGIFITFRNLVIAVPIEEL